MDPGAVPLDLKAPYPPIPEEGERQQVAKMCKWCKAVKPYSAHHCSTCERCVIRMDHHCPWVNNCVAILNQKYFMLFLFYTALCCIYSGVLLVARFVSCTHNIRQCSLTGIEAGLCIVNFVEALVFGLFVIIMLFDQFSAIFENTGKDSPGYKQGKIRTKYDALKEVFGEGFSWRWFFPLDVTPLIRQCFELENKQIQWVYPLTKPKEPIHPETNISHEKSL